MKFEELFDKLCNMLLWVTMIVIPAAVIIDTIIDVLR